MLGRDTGERAFLAGLAKVGDRDAHARGSARLDPSNSTPTIRRGHEDERWPHASGASVDGDRRDCRGDTARCRRHHDDHETAIAAAEQVEDAQGDRQSWKRSEKGYHSNQTLIDLAVGTGPKPDRRRRIGRRFPGPGAGVWQSSRMRTTRPPPDERGERSFAHAVGQNADRHLTGSAARASSEPRSSQESAAITCTTGC